MSKVSSTSIDNAVFFHNTGKFSKHKCNCELSYPDHLYLTMTSVYILIYKILQHVLFFVCSVLAFMSKKYASFCDFWLYSGYTPKEIRNLCEIGLQILGRKLQMVTQSNDLSWVFARSAYKPFLRALVLWCIVYNHCHLSSTSCVLSRSLLCPYWYTETG